MPSGATIGRRRPALRVTRRYVVAAGEQAAAEFEAAERTIARMIARAYMSDHPELFPLCKPDIQDFGAPPTAAAEASPGASGGAPKHQEPRRNDNLKPDGPDG
jgi:hypothetical protein